MRLCVTLLACGLSSMITFVSLALCEELKLRAVLDGHEKGVYAIAFSMDDSLLASASSDEPVVQLWDVKTRQLKNTLNGDAKGVINVDFSPKSLILAVSFADGNVRLWNAKSGMLESIFVTRSNANPMVKFNPDGKTLAIGWDQIDLWNLATNKLIRSLPNDEYGPRFVSGLQFSPNGSELVAAGGRLAGYAFSWNILSGEKRCCENQIQLSPSLTIHPDGKLLAVTNPGNGQIQFYFLNESITQNGGVEIPEVIDMRLKSTWPESILFHPGGNVLAVASMTPDEREGRIDIFDISRQATESFSKPPQLILSQAHSSYKKVNCIAYSSDGKTLASGGEDGKIYLWDISDAN